MLFYLGEWRPTPGLVSPIPILATPPTRETTPQKFLVIGIGIMHKLWTFILPKEPSMAYGGITEFGIKLGGVRGMII